MPENMTPEERELAEAADESADEAATADVGTIKQRPPRNPAEEEAEIENDLDSGD